MRRIKSADKFSIMALDENILCLAHHRSRQRIQHLGEVFTPEKYVQQMLDMLGKLVWTSTDTVFFEPTCGHGNFVEAIVERRLNALLKKAKRQKIKDPQLYAVANTLNTLWAIDIDPENIKFCQDRVQALVFQFLWSNEQHHSTGAATPLKSFIRNNY